MLDKILAVEGDQPQRNGIGPVGVYTRNTYTARQGYESLKAWERSQGSNCRIIVTVGAYGSIARFIAYAASKGEPWIYSAVSFTGADNFASELRRFRVVDRVIMTQVVPLPDSGLTIVRTAQNALGKEYGYVSQEGYIVGKMLLRALRQMQAEGKEITRENVLAWFHGSHFELEGLNLDFEDDNQGSDLVVMTALDGTAWIPMQDGIWQRWVAQMAQTSK